VTVLIHRSLQVLRARAHTNVPERSKGARCTFITSHVDILSDHFMFKLCFLLIQDN
jgi:hypothetical protein